MRLPRAPFVALLAVLPACGGGDGGDGSGNGLSAFPGWAVRAGGIDDETATKVAVFSDDSFVAVGRFRGEATFGEDQPGETVLESEGSEDVFVARYDDEGTLLWARRDGGPGSEMAFDVDVVEEDGSCVVTGVYTDGAVFGSGEKAERTLETEDSIHTATFVARYDGDGSLQWVTSAAGPGSNGGTGIGAMPDGSCVVGGYYYAITLGAGEANETAFTSDTGLPGMFVARFGPQGALAWARQGFAPTGQVFANGLDTLPDGSSFVTGRFSSTMTLGLGESRSDEIEATSFGNADVFVAHYDGDGVPQWVRNAGSTTGQEEGHDVAAVPDGTAVVTGSYGAPAVFGFGDPNEAVLAGFGMRDVFFARYAAGGTLLWARGAGGPDDDLGLGIAVHADASVYVCGVFRGVARFGEAEPRETDLEALGTSDAFVARLFTNGDLRWVRPAASAGAARASGVCVLSDRSCVIAGNFSNIGVFGSPPEEVLTSAGATDVFLARYGPNGEF